MLIYAGFIIGFDGERAGAGERIQAFVEQTHIPQPMVGILQAPPNTALWNRLHQEQRLLTEAGGSLQGDQNTLMNFIPTRPVEEIAQEYVTALWTLYEPKHYLRRCLRQCLAIQPSSYIRQTAHFPPKKALKLVRRLIWHQGIQMGEIRRQFWQQLWVMVRHRPQLLQLYLGLCAAGEHFWDYRQLARECMAQEIGYDVLTETPTVDVPEPELAFAGSPRIDH